MFSKEHKIGSSIQNWSVLGETRKQKQGRLLWGRAPNRGLHLLRTTFKYQEEDTKCTATHIVMKNHVFWWMASRASCMLGRCSSSRYIAGSQNLLIFFSYKEEEKKIPVTSEHHGWLQVLDTKTLQKVSLTCLGNSLKTCSNFKY